MPGLCHRSWLRGQFHLPAHVLGREMRIAQDHGKRAVSEDLLQGLQTATAHDEPRREGVPQVVEPAAIQLGRLTAVSKAFLTLRSGQTRPTWLPLPGRGQGLVDNVAHRDLTTAPALGDPQPQNVAGQVDAIPP